MSDEFLLAWEDFQQNMATGFKQVLQNKEFVDVTLVSGDDVKINAHRIIQVCAIRKHSPPPHYLSERCKL